MLKSRIITALIVVVVLLMALFFLPEIGWDAVIIVLALQASIEWAKLAKVGKAFVTIYCMATLLGMVGLAALVVFHNPYIYPVRSFMYVLSAIFWVAVVPVWLRLGFKVKHQALLAVVGWIVIIPTALSMIELRVISPWLLLFVMCLVWIADIFAYFAGRKFGKNKLAPSISPGKTWEGVAGAMCGVMLYVVLVWVLNSFFQKYLPLVGFLIVAVLWVYLAVLGDLFESAVKRQAGVKDSGALLPGHGGLLDRIDALTSTLPLAALFIIILPAS